MLSFSVYILEIVLFCVFITLYRCNYCSCRLHAIKFGLVSHFVMISDCLELNRILMNSRVLKELLCKSSFYLILLCKYAERSVSNSTVQVSCFARITL